MPDYAGVHARGRRTPSGRDAAAGARRPAVEVETPHPRAAVKRLAERLDGRVLESVEAVGKNLLLRFEGGLVLRSHLRMNGRWRVEPRGARRDGLPVARPPRRRARGRALERAGARARPRRPRSRSLGPDILASPPDFDAMLARLRAQPQSREVGDALLDQRLVAGIGNMWKAEALWEARVSPWRAARRRLATSELRDDARRRAPR